MKFGDIVVNKWAGSGNPQKVLMVVSGGEIINCLSLKGERVLFDNHPDLDLRKVGSVDFSEWGKIAHQHLNDADPEGSASNLIKALDVIENL